MNKRRPLAMQWKRLGPRFLPFADAASAELPLPRLLRLSLFQVSVGMAAALLVGTLNRVMIVELGMAAWLVALMVALPIVAAPLRALIGHRSDTYASAIGWRRVPYVGLGSFLQFGGLSIMPFALLLLSGQGELGLAWVGKKSKISFQSAVAMRAVISSFCNPQSAVRNPVRSPVSVSKPNFTTASYSFSSLSRN